jgi:hypothetical protein
VETGELAAAPTHAKKIIFPVFSIIIYMVLAKIIKQLKFLPLLILFFGSVHHNRGLLINILMCVIY